MKTNTELLAAITESEMFRGYARAFSDATGLPLALRSIESWQPPLRGSAKEGGFCALMAKKSASCAACLRFQETLTTAASDDPTLMKCHFGLTDVAVPVKLGGKLIGHLITGQVFTQEPSAKQFQSAVRTAAEMGVDVSVPAAREAWVKTRVMPRTQLAAAAKLLTVFAEHIAMKANQLVIRQANAEPIAVVRAKAYIREHLIDDITLTDLANAACTSTYYICKLFKKHTGVNFTEYVSRLRVERARELLANPRLRISEIAYEVGFQSLTHFNRTFRTLAGQSPTEFRDESAMPLAA